jgi:DNA-binding transcriptional MerR regulator
MVAVKSDYKISEGAAFVGCHPNTLRSLDRLGIIRARRNYLGYRVFSLQDLLKLKTERETLKEETLRNE